MELHQETNEISQRAEWRTILDDEIRSNLENILIQLSDELNGKSNDPESRESAAFQLKYVLTSQDPEVKEQKREKWLSFSKDSRTRIKKNILKSMNVQIEKSDLIVKCVSHISCAELPRGEWNELPVFLDENITSSDSNENLKQITLDTISCICDEIDDDLATDQLNDAIIRILYHVFKYEESVNLKLAALNLFLICIKRLRVVFENGPENQLMLDALCDTILIENAKISSIAIQSLEKVVMTYYAHVRHLVNNDLLTITIRAIKEENIEIRLKGLKLLQSVCFQEEKLLATNGVQDYALFFHEYSLKLLLPILLITATIEVVSIDVYNKILEKIMFCLSFIVSYNTDLTLDYVNGFVRENIDSLKWSSRNAAVMVLDSVVRKCKANELSPLIEFVLPKIRYLIVDLNPLVKSSTIKILKYLTENFITIITSNVELDLLIENLVKILDPQSNDAILVCETINGVMHIAYCKSIEDIDSDENAKIETYCLSVIFNKVLLKFVKLMMQNDITYSDLRKSIHDTLHRIIKESPEDCKNDVVNIMDPIVESLGQILKNENSEKDEILLLMLPILKTSIEKIPTDCVFSYADEVLTLMFRLLNTSGDKISIKAVKVVTVIAKILKSDFIKYMESFKPYLMKGLVIYNIGTHDNYKIGYFHTAIHSMAEICHGVRYQFLCWFDEIIPVFVNVFEGGNIRYGAELRPIFSLLSIVDDVAVLMGGEFKKYYDDVFKMLTGLWQQIEKMYTSKAIMSRLWEQYRQTCSDIIVAVNDDECVAGLKDLIKRTENINN